MLGLGPSSSSPYHFFDQIVCINLETVPERRLYAQGVFDRLGIPARFFTAQKHPKGGRYGCFDSHVQVVRQAYESGAQYLLVFEDDIIPTPACLEPGAMDGVIRFLQAGPGAMEGAGWDILYLGYLPFCMDWRPHKGCYLTAPSVPGHPGLVQYNPVTTHAMCYNRRSMKKVLDGYEAAIGTIHYDIWLATDRGLGMRNVCCAPMLFEQSFSFSSSIPAHNLLEGFGRWIIPCMERHMPFYRASLLKRAIMDEQDHAIWAVWWVLVVALILLALRRFVR